MTLAEQIDQDLVAAMKGREELRLSTLRMMKSALKLKQVELGKPLDDAVAAAIFRTLVKQRHDSAEQFRKGGREELAAKEEAEIKIVEGYLPASASDEEIDAAVAAAIVEVGGETGVTAAKDMGKVMKAVMARLADKSVDGKRVSEKVRAQLGA